MTKALARATDNVGFVDALNFVSTRCLMGFMSDLSRVMGPLGRGLLLMLSFSSIVYSRETISSRNDLGHMLERAVMCNVSALGAFDGSEFSGGPGDALYQLETLGVDVSIDGEDDSGGIRYHLPDGIDVFGYQAVSARYFSESTTLFFVVLKVGAKNFMKINKILKLRPIENGNPDGYGYVDGVDARYVRKLRKPGVDFPDTILSGLKNGGGHNYIVVGCQNLAW